MNNNEETADQIRLRQTKRMQDTFKLAKSKLIQQANQNVITVLGHPAH